MIIQSIILNGQYNQSYDNDDNGKIDIIDVFLQKYTTKYEYDVTSPGFYYNFSTIRGDNPGLELVNPKIEIKRNDSLILNLDLSSFHPIKIFDKQTNEDIISSQTTGTVKISSNEQKELRYICVFHPYNMVNDIIIN